MLILVMKIWPLNGMHCFCDKIKNAITSTDKRNREYFLFTARGDRLLRCLQFMARNKFTGCDFS